MCAGFGVVRSVRPLMSSAFITARRLLARLWKPISQKAGAFIWWAESSSSSKRPTAPSSTLSACSAMANWYGRSSALSLGARPVKNVLPDIAMSMVPPRTPWIIVMWLPSVLFGKIWI